MSLCVEEESICEIIVPALANEAYYFKTSTGIRYEVRFVKKADNYFSAIIAFGVLNDEFDDDEYCVTNKGEPFHVMQAVVTITKHYLNRCPYVIQLEFSCEGSCRKKQAQRLQLYYRFFKKSAGNNWQLNYTTPVGICLTKIFN